MIDRSKWTPVRKDIKIRASDIGYVQRIVRDFLAL